MSDQQIDHRVIALYLFLVPFVRPVVEKKMDEAIATPYAEDEVRKISREVGQELLDRGASFADIKAAMKEVRHRLRNPQAVTPEERDAMATDVTNEATAAIVMTWMNALVIAPPGGPDDERTLDLSTLDDCMLPPIGGMVNAIFDFFLPSIWLTPDEARGILRAVRASLPKGQVIPGEVVALLLAENITVDDGGD